MAFKLRTLSLLDGLKKSNNVHHLNGKYRNRKSKFVYDGLIHRLFDVKKLAKCLRSKTNVSEENGRTCKYASRGPIHGTFVHREIETAIFKMRRGVKPVLKDGCSRAILKHLHAKKLIPLAAETIVSNDSVATGVDIVAADAKTGRSVFIELKTGFESRSYDRQPGDGRIFSDVESLKYCPRDLHDVQLSATCLLADPRPDMAIVLLYQPKSRTFQSWETSWWKSSSDERTKAVVRRLETKRIKKKIIK